MANRRPRATVGALVLLSASFPSLAAHSAARGYSPATVCTGGETKSRWCIQNTVPDAQDTLPSAFCAYGDKVIATLEDVFNIPAGEVFEFELDTRTGGAHTGREGTMISRL